MPKPARGQLPAAAYWLGYGALAPFVAGAVIMLLRPDAAQRELAGRALVAYGALVLAGLGGVHWRFALQGGAVRSPLRAALAVLPAVAGAAAVLLPLETAIAVLVGAFGGCWLYENRVLGPAIVPPAYLALRRWFTLGVVAALGLALMSSSLAPATS